MLLVFAEPYFLKKYEFICLVSWDRNICHNRWPHTVRVRRRYTLGQMAPHCSGRMSPHCPGQMRVFETSQPLYVGPGPNIEPRHLPSSIKTTHSSRTFPKLRICFGSISSFVQIPFELQLWTLLLTAPYSHVVIWLLIRITLQGI